MYNKMKKCIKCKKEQELTKYAKDSSRKDRLATQCRECYHLHNKKRNLLPKNRLRSIITVRLNLNKRLGLYTRGKTYKEELGCELSEWQLYLEKQWYGEMDWNNFGTHWQIHHIEPLNLNQNFHYTNTQPLTKEDHRELHSKYGY